MAAIPFIFIQLCYLYHSKILNFYKIFIILLQLKLQAVMTKFTLFLAMFSLTIFSSCSNSDFEDGATTGTIDAEYNTPSEADIDTSDEGEVEFTIDNQNSQVLEKDALLLTNNSKNAISYHWDFGNDDTSTEAIPSYTYDRHGQYTITLVITDKYNNTKEVSHDITVICLFAGEDHGNN